MTFVWVAVAGAVGSCLRYGVGLAGPRWFGRGFPWATLGVNLIGCFAIGILAVILEARGVDAKVRAALITGLLGGFTTYSAFALDTIQLAERRSLAMAGVYLALSIVGGLAGCWLGLVLGRRI